MTSKREVFILIAWLAAALLLATLTWRVQAATGHMAVDRHGADWVATLRSEPLTALMRTLHKLQGKVVAAAILIGVAVLVWRRRWPSLLLLVTMVPLGMLANSGLKLLVERPRPGLNAAVGSHGFSFASGHTVAITLFCGYLVIQTFRTHDLVAVAHCGHLPAPWPWSRWWRSAGSTWVCIMSSDVVATVLLGVMWLGLCLSGELMAEGVRPGPRCA